MDTSKLVVGQHVDMSNGCYGNEGEVIAVTPEGVDALTMGSYYASTTKVLADLGVARLSAAFGT